jgi:hypothetical protein
MYVYAYWAPALRGLFRNLEVAMELFVHQQNLLFLRRQLAETLDQARRLLLLKLLAEEEAKNQRPPIENSSLDTSHDGSGDCHEQIR